MAKNKKKNQKVAEEPSKEAAPIQNNVNKKAPAKQNGKPAPAPVSNASPLSKKGKKNLKKKQIGALKDNKPDTKPKVAVEEIKTPEGSPVKLDKRAKNRVKTQLKKDLILKGKTNVLLNNMKVLEKKIIKLKAKPEPHSQKALRKIQLIESLLEKAKKQGYVSVGTEKKDVDQDNTATKSENKTKKDKKEKSAPAQNGTKPTQEASKLPQKEKQIQKVPPKQKSQNNDDNADNSNQFVIFVGNLPLDVNKQTLREHFSTVEGLEKIRVPKPKKKKKRAFAYIQFANEESRQKALELHGTLISEIPINVLYADRKTGKKNAQAENVKLEEQRKVAASVGDKQLMKVGKKIQEDNKKQKQNKMKKAPVNVKSAS